MPSPFVQEVLIKSILVTLNDAVASDNFTVLHAKISKPFRDQFPPDKLRTVFKDLVEKHAVFDAIVASPVVPDEDAKIDDKGVLRLKGRFDTAPKKVKYQLGSSPPTASGNSAASASISNSGPGVQNAVPARFGFGSSPSASRGSGVIFSAVMRLRSRRSTRKRQPWKVKLWPRSGIERAS